ncbi:hypothetical protein CP556_14360 [Natrinema sp. CBA1119]|uniref:hypothetical protein n=1 Tax=Natrinema sp. CBA1119 TaxID=1608465 RepID=UPI000BF891DF|nr:hypothetical protein [Natrinema sp. CBA1119]PGF17181.1 hypothetical protein CP556_14360 [Natrinema sp. CBA1119]
MAYIPLGGSEETHVIFDGGIPTHLADLSASEQRDLLTKLRNIAREDAPPDGYVYEQIGNLDIIKFSGTGRTYTKVVTFIPERNTHYHIIYVLYVDEDHDYDQGGLGKLSQQAQQTLEMITNLESVKDVETYLEDQNSLTADDLDDLLDR